VAVTETLKNQPKKMSPPKKDPSEKKEEKKRRKEEKRKEEKKKRIKKRKKGWEAQETREEGEDRWACRQTYCTVRKVRTVRRYTRGRCTCRKAQGRRLLTISRRSDNGRPLLARS
jgi:hypothetical protein